MNCSYYMNPNSDCSSPNESFQVFTPKSDALTFQDIQINEKFEQPGKKLLQTTSRKSKKIGKGHKEGQKKAKKVQEWSQISKNEYFYAIILFSVENPDHHISWGLWKQKRFYKCIQKHLGDHVEQKDRKGFLQCKSKDQNLKKKYYLNAAKPIDILDLSISELESGINRMKKTQNEEIPHEDILYKIERYQGVIQMYENTSAQKPTQQKPYQFHLQKLSEYNDQQMSFINSLLTEVLL